MKEVSNNNSIKLPPHFTLGELTKTSYHPLDGNIPSRENIENLTRICENWLEDLRFSYNKLYVMRNEELEMRNDDYHATGDSPKEEPIIFNSGFRSPETNRLAGGARNSNHLTGCAVDIRCLGKAQAIRYACILLDIADEKEQNFDELILEKRVTTVWLHFAVKPRGIRRYVGF